MEDARHDLANRADAVGEFLLVDHSRETPVAGWPGRRQIQEMSDNALPNARERIARELFEHIVQAMNTFFGQDQRHGRVLLGQAFHPRHVHEVDRAVSQRLHEYGSRPPNERGRTEQAAAPNVAHRHLAAVTGVHIYTEKPTNHDREPFRIGLGVDRGATEDIEGLAIGREPFHGVDGQ